MLHPSLDLRFIRQDEARNTDTYSIEVFECPAADGVASPTTGLLSADLKTSASIDAQAEGAGSLWSGCDQRLWRDRSTAGSTRRRSKKAGETRPTEGARLPMPQRMATSPGRASVSPFPPSG
jgi:hypothetical protein